VEECKPLAAGELVELLNFVFTTFDDQVGALVGRCSLTLSNPR